MKAIETKYAGCRFRSRLEAKWAVFFDALGTEWEYEPQGYETSAGPYLPDFRLIVAMPFPTPTWFEVKPSHAPEDPRHAAFAAGGEFLTVARGMPRSYLDQYAGEQLVTIYTPGHRRRRMPTGFFPWSLDDAGATMFNGPVESEIGLKADLDVTAAYTAARSARFEHGETPTVARR